MVALAFDGRAIWLGQNGLHFLRFQITSRALGRDPHNRSRAVNGDAAINERTEMSGPASPASGTPDATGRRSCDQRRKRRRAPLRCALTVTAPLCVAGGRGSGRRAFRQDFDGLKRRRGD
jgi:hypothetical protein